jgi:hypothetical protein
LVIASVFPVATPAGSLAYWAGPLVVQERPTIVVCGLVGNVQVSGAGSRVGVLGRVKKRKQGFRLATGAVGKSVAHLRERKEEGGKREKGSLPSNNTSWSDPPFPTGDGGIRLLKIFIVKPLQREKKRS